MGFVTYNPNPMRARVGDCAIRAVAKATGQTWDAAFVGLYVQGYSMADLPSANVVWGSYLRERGFRREPLADSYPDFYTVEDFCRDHPAGTFVLALEGHVVTVENGDYYDTWKSGGEPILYYWKKEEA